MDEPNNLFNYTNIGYQTYYNSQEEIDLIEKLFFDAYRLGEISNNIELSEPTLRDADIVSLDLNSVKSSYSGNFVTFTPNGFDGKEICSLSRYAGISDKVSSLGIFNFNNKKEESVLISQIIWYFIEGVNYRSNEYPFGTKENYLKLFQILADYKRTGDYQQSYMVLKEIFKNNCEDLIIATDGNNWSKWIDPKDLDDKDDEKEID